MADTKQWYLSKTIWGSLLAVFAALASLFGFDLDNEMQDALAEAILQFIAVAGSIFAVFGRLTARTVIL